MSEDRDCARCGATMLSTMSDEEMPVCDQCDRAVLSGLCDDYRAQLAKAEADAEAHRMRCVSLETQLEAAKRATLESDRRAHEAEAACGALSNQVEIAVTGLQSCAVRAPDAGRIVDNALAAIAAVKP